MCVSVIMKYSQRAFVRMRETSVRDFAYNCTFSECVCVLIVLTQLKSVDSS